MTNQEQYEMLCDNTIKGRCGDCKYYQHDNIISINNAPLILVHDICTKWGRGCKTKADGYCFLFETYEKGKKNKNI